MLMPSPFFLNWWQQVAQIRYGDKQRCIDVAKELGYVSKDGEPLGFEYDPVMARSSLGIPEGMPLVNESESPECYQRLRSWLLSERG